MSPVQLSSSGWGMVWDSLSGTALWEVFWAVAPVWVFGAVVGFLLPRPKWLTGGTRAGALFLAPPGTGLRRLALAFHGAVILREVWYYFTIPGTFRKLSVAVWDWMRGRGFYFEWPSKSLPSSDSPFSKQALASPQTRSWYVTEDDLEFFKDRALNDVPLPGASQWDCVLQKDIPNFIRYQAWRRTLKNGKTEYKSVTIAPDVSAEEFNDMYFDDEFRPKWDTMVTHHEVLEHGDFSKRQQVVRWIRSFPFSFLSDREYVIARQQFVQDGKIYGISKAVNNHPRSPASGLVKMDVFHSMWACENVECPWGTGAPTCQTVLLHHEEFKIPENLARFAVRHGMWGFVRKLSSTVPEWTALRRSRCGPYDADTNAFGAGLKPNPPSMHRSPSTTSTGSWTTDSSSLSGSSSASSSVCSEDDDLADGLELEAVGPGRRIRSLLALALAGGVAIVVNRKVSSVSRTKKHGHGHHHHRRHHHHHSHHHAAHTAHSAGYTSHAGHAGQVRHTSLTSHSLD